MASKKQANTGVVTINASTLIGQERTIGTQVAKLTTMTGDWVNVRLAAFAATGVARDASGGEAFANSLRAEFIAAAREMSNVVKDDASFNAACVAILPSNRVTTWRCYMAGAAKAYAVSGALWTTHSHKGKHVGPDGKPLETKAAKAAPTAPGKVESVDPAKVDAEPQGKASTDPFTIAFAVINRDPARKVLFVNWVQSHADWK